MQLCERELGWIFWATALVFHVCLASIISVGAAHAQLNPCPYTNDGDCDEPNGLGLCAPGTDVADCSNPNSNFGGGSGYAAGGGFTGGLSGTPGGGAVGMTIYSPWVSVTNDPNQFRGQRAGVFPSSTCDSATGRGSGPFPAGSYDIYTGNAGNTGSLPPTDIRMATVTLHSNRIYTVDLGGVNGFGFRDSSGLESLYGAPGEGYARIYHRNSDTRTWRALCILPTGWDMTWCGTDMSGFSCAGSSVSANTTLVGSWRLEDSAGVPENEFTFQFLSNGVVQAGPFSGNWSQQADGTYLVQFTSTQWVNPQFSIAISSDGRSFTAYFDGSIIGYGYRM
ncbi:hypothetical protein [Roseicyclus elongatus]|uniref:hypothetical protein n=1 Tax=Roseicyclus elongatus TaxID=159346 RepID=UPI0012EC3A6A|nr:hypothetical protein [Roseibacterium elongatum]